MASATPFAALPAPSDAWPPFRAAASRAVEAPFRALDAPAPDRFLADADPLRGPALRDERDFAAADERFEPPEPWARRADEPLPLDALDRVDFPCDVRRFVVP
jgi:hypothetical protein